MENIGGNKMVSRCFKITKKVLSFMPVGVKEGINRNKRRINGKPTTLNRFGIADPISWDERDKIKEDDINGK